MNRLLFTRLKFNTLETDKSLVQGSEIAVAIEVGIHLNDVSPLAVARIPDGYRHLSVSFIGWFGCRSILVFEGSVRQSVTERELWCTLLLFLRSLTIIHIGITPVVDVVLHQSVGAVLAQLRLRSLRQFVDVSIPGRSQVSAWVDIAEDSITDSLSLSLSSVPRF